MKQVLFFCAAGVFCAQLSSAAPCVGGTLASYLSLGSGGCTIGDNTLSNFQLLSGSSGAAPISSADVTLTPLGGSLNPGLTTIVNESASGGSALETIFTFQLSGSPYIADVLTLSGASETVDGGVSGVQNYCSDGAFGPDGVTGCTGIAGALVTVDGFQNQDSAALTTANLLSVTNDLVIDGGQFGTAAGGTLTDRFTATPEPFTFLLTGLGLALALGVKALRRPEFIRN